MFKLSTDYSPFGKFSMQILRLCLLTAPLGGGLIFFSILSLTFNIFLFLSVPVLFLMGIFGVILVSLGIYIYHWGMTKQDRELFG